MKLKELFLNEIIWLDYLQNHQLPLIIIFHAKNKTVRLLKKTFHIKSLRKRGGTIEIIHFPTAQNN